MKKRGNRKGQFYIIAAIIIIAVLIGIATYVNYAKTKKEYTKVYDLGKELEIETGYVYDYGVYNEENLNRLVENWTDVYLNYTIGQNIIEDWIFVYGNKDYMTAVTFTTETSGEVGIYAGGQKLTIPIEVREKTEESIPAGEVGSLVNVTFLNFSHMFELQEGENFFFVIRREEYTAES